MQPIQTRYKKCFFRSRLEARWAVFFDAIGIPWEYEKEGYKLSDGTWYLPDFWLPSMSCFFEVKGQAPTDAERDRAFLLSEEAKQLVVIASGVMNVESLKYNGRDFGEWPVSGFNIEAFGGKPWSMWSAPAFDFWMWNWILSTDLPPFISHTFGSEYIGIEDSENRRKILVELDIRYYALKYQKDHPRYRWGRYEKRVYWADTANGIPIFSLEPADPHGRLSSAYEAARSARFEHSTIAV